ncbi:DUF7373 family lipoprotein [Nocardia sp. CA-136227]|uniref:DUF7373 family lipoprotein n=1 Tax=Nocardia sp. CA-136227 TaxID=3239979 RepID=UPI003D99BEE1
MKRLETDRGYSRTAFGMIALGIATIMGIPALAGCGIDTSGAAVAAEVDVRHFPIGNYSTDPLEFRANYHRSVIDGTQLAIARLADSVVSGADVDPKFDQNLRVDVLSTLGSALRVLGDPVQSALEGNGMMFGFSASVGNRPLTRLQDPDSTYNYSLFGGTIPAPGADSFSITVLQLPDRQRAQAASEQMAAADFGVAPDRNAHITLDRHPSAAAHWRPGVPTMAATATEGQYVVDVFTALPTPDLGALRELTDKVLDAELPLLDRTPALSAREVYRLNYDPDGMLRRTLHPFDFLGIHGLDEVTHSPRGYLHLVENAGAWKPLLAANGVDRVSTAHKGALLLRTPNAKAATALWDGINGLPGEPVDKPEGVPDVVCARNSARRTNSWSGFETWYTDDTYVCNLHYDRYVARVASDQLLDAQQRAAAQYALLANSQWM